MLNLVIYLDIPPLDVASPMLRFVSSLALVLSYFILSLCFFFFSFPLGSCCCFLFPCLHYTPSSDIPYRLPLLLTYMVTVQNFSY